MSTTNTTLESYFTCPECGESYRLLNRWAEHARQVGMCHNCEEESQAAKEEWDALYGESEKEE